MIKFHNTKKYRLLADNRWESAQLTYLFIAGMSATNTYVWLAEDCSGTLGWLLSAMPHCNNLLTMP